MIHKGHVAEDVQKDIEIVEKLNEFIESRLKNKAVSFCDLMKRLSLKTCKTSLKETTLKVGEKQ